MDICVVSVNLGFNVISNTSAGSERIQVDRARQKYGFDLHPISKLSYPTTICLDNIFKSFKFSSTPVDIIGFQEVNSEYSLAIRTYISFLTSDSYEFHEHGYGFNTMIVSRRDKLGPGIIINPSDFALIKNNPKRIDKRPLQAVYYPQVKYLVINLHAPHRLDLRSTLQNRLDILGCIVDIYGYEVNRCLITGDFNDYTGSMLDHVFTFKNLKIRMHLYHTSKYTCCTDVNYIYSGDYILDSYSECVFYGIPPSYDMDEKHEILSDHRPVILQS